MTLKIHLLAFSVLLLLGVSPLAAQYEESHEPDSRTFSIDEQGSTSQLGVGITIKPLAGRESISGFQVGLSYKDPFYGDSPEVSILAPSFFQTSCARHGQEIGAYQHTNERKTRFSIRLIQGCKEAPRGLLVPFLKIEIQCSNIAREIQYLRARQEGQLFYIAPTGDWRQVQTNTGKALEMAKDLYDIYDTVSTVLVLFDFVAGTHGSLTAGKFVLKMVKGKIADIAVDALFEYSQSQYGMRPEFNHTGWTILCRLCGRRFHRRSLADGEILQCPNTHCRAVVRLRFR